MRQPKKRIGSMTPEPKPDLVVSIPTRLPVKAEDLKRIRSILQEQFDQVRVSFVDGSPRRLEFECINLIKDWVEVEPMSEEEQA